MIQNALPFFCKHVSSRILIMTYVFTLLFYIFIIKYQYIGVLLKEESS